MFAFPPDDVEGYATWGGIVLAAALPAFLFRALALRALGMKRQTLTIAGTTAFGVLAALVFCVLTHERLVSHLTWIIASQVASDSGFASAGIAPMSFFMLACSGLVISLLLDVASRMMLRTNGAQTGSAFLGVFLAGAYVLLLLHAADHYEYGIPAIFFLYGYADGPRRAAAQE